MPVRPYLRRLAGLAALASLALPAAAIASRSQEAMFQDDALLVYRSRAEVGQTLDTFKALGVDRIRVAVYWQIVAPAYDSRTKPNFDATDPSAYPQQNWRPYDTIVELARERGILVNFNVGGAVPLWATQPAPSEDIATTYYPSPSEFEKFMTAVGRRYSGSYRPPPAPAAPAPSGPLPVNTGAGNTPLSGSAAPTAATPSSTLPRVSFWSMWNEPNQAAFLTPQWSTRDGVRTETAPIVYRRLVDAGWRALHATGHGDDRFLVGELAPIGRDSRQVNSSLKPLRFLRRLYCVDDRLRPLAGTTAARYDCPRSDQRRAFPAAHPGLFGASGFADHPYALLNPPSRPTLDREFVGIADLGRLTGALQRVLHGAYARDTLPIYNTEFGYQTKPPDPFGFSPALQAAYLNEAEFMTYSNPRVRTTMQFLLLDSGPDTRYPSSSPLYWSTFQTGLIDLNNHPKPAFAAYRMPVFVPHATRRRGGSFRVWGAARPAANASRQRVRIEFRGAGSGSFATIRTVTTTSLRNYVDTHVSLHRSGTLRLAWTSPAGRTLHSRDVAIRIG